ncbi:MAG: hypothetical protein AB1420_18815 [Bacillota bacterium]
MSIVVHNLNKLNSESSGRFMNRQINSILKTIGVFSALSIILIWLYFTFSWISNNGGQIIFSTFLMIFLPACLALVGSLKLKSTYLYVAFVWTLPAALYILLTPTFFRYIGFITFFYLLVGILINIVSTKHNDMATNK